MFRPSEGRILVKPDEREKETGSGILIPDTAKEDLPVSGIVVVGEEKCNIFKDERVLFSKYGSDEIEIDGIKYCVVSIKQILGTF